MAFKYFCADSSIQIKSARIQKGRKTSQSTACKKKFFKNNTADATREPADSGHGFEVR